MASIRDLRTRIQSVKNTQQTTRAMKMVSAAKLRRAQEAIVGNRPYAKGVGKLIRLVSSISDVKIESPLLRRDPVVALEHHVADTARGKKLLIVLVTSDRGLCGGFNASIIKGAQRWLTEHSVFYSSVSMAFIGRKGLEYFRRRGIKEQFSEEFGRKVDLDLANRFVDWVVGAYSSAAFDEVKIVYNEFKNAISQKVIVEDFLPIQAEEQEAMGLSGAGTTSTAADTYLVKPSADFVLEQLLKKHFAIQVYRILLESNASEHGSRMSSMESATRNAGEMIQKLTLQYNKQRQAGITKELLEIISGSEAQK